MSGSRWCGVQAESSHGISHRLAVVLVAVVLTLAVVVAYCLAGIGIARAGDDDVSCRSGGAVVIVAGTNDPEGAAMIGVEQRYTGTGVASGNGNAGKYDVIYADYPTTLWPLGAAGYDDSVAQGKASTASAIADYQATCPGKPVVVAGYSQGARVAGDVLSEIGNSPSVDYDAAPDPDGEYWLVDVNNTPDDLSDDVLIDKYARDESGNILLDADGNPVSSISGELYSDPRQAGTKEGRGIELSLIGVIPGLTMTGSRGVDDEDPGFGELDDNIVSVCVDGDPICDLPDPLYDPIGALDGLLGYFTKHGLYPWQMYHDPDQATWGAAAQTGLPAFPRTVTCADDVCRVSAESSLAELMQYAANLVGLGDIAVPDLLAGRPTLDLPFGIELSNLQPAIRVVLDLLPPLPQLGYGAYLPDLFTFQNVIEGIATLSPAQFKEGVTDLAESVKSIVLLPRNWVKYWAAESVGTVSTVTATASSSSPDTVAAIDPDPAEVASVRRIATVLGKADWVPRVEVADHQSVVGDTHDGAGDMGTAGDRPNGHDEDGTYPHGPSATPIKPPGIVHTDEPGNPDDGTGVERGQQESGQHDSGQHDSGRHDNNDGSDGSTANDTRPQATSKTRADGGTSDDGGDTRNSDTEGQHAG